MSEEARKQLWGFCESCHCQQVAICQDCKKLLKDVADDPNLRDRIRNANKVIESREQTIKQLNAHADHTAAIREKAEAVIKHFYRYDNCECGVPISLHGNLTSCSISSNGTAELAALKAELEKIK